MRKHTSGPWRIGKKFPNNSLFPRHKDITPIYWDAPPCDSCGTSSGQYVIAHVFDGALPGQKVTAKANAQLIAAAPDLAQVLYAYVQLMDDDGQRVYALGALREEMHAALRKAGYDVPEYVSEV